MLMSCLLIGCAGMCFGYAHVVTEDRQYLTRKSLLCQQGGALGATCLFLYLALV